MTRDLAYMIAAMALVILAYRSHKIEAKVGSLSVKADRTLEKATEIDQCVNNTPGPRLVQRVIDQGKALDDLCAKVDSLSAEMLPRGELARQLDLLEQIARRQHPDEFAASTPKDDSNEHFS